MRVTHKTINNNLLHNLNSSLKRLNRYNEQLASGRRISLPSDNPVEAENIMRLKTSLSQNDQYLKNVEDGISWLDATDSALDQLTGILHRVRELAIAGSNESLEESAREALATEIKELFDSVIQVANTTHGGKYLFAGQKTAGASQPFTNAWGSEPPFVRQDGITGEIVIEIGAGSQVAINVVDEDTDGLFTKALETIAKTYDDIMNGNIDSLSNETLKYYDETMDLILTARSETGAKQNRLEVTKERLKDLDFNFNRLLSSVQAVDVAETIMHLKAEENIYQLALAVGARIIRPTLVDFLG
ncbi:MAG: flagellar hook-associated protein FlgL [Firmicutes bacterium]|jgi:flagellar hook-associated protein 3 FlgL|nr:flagellar hook-associated protein FlgL [Bacillota bacterium]